MHQRLLAVTGATMAFLAAGAGTALAADHYVNDDVAVSNVDSSCKKPGYSTIASAVAAAAPGDSVTVCAGTYAETDISVDKPLTIAGTGGPKVVPPSEDENLDSSFGGVANNAFLVRSDDVTIRTLTIDGRGNPALTAGKNNFRTGAVTDNALGQFDNTTFDRLKVFNIYRRSLQVVGGTGHLITGNEIRGVAVPGSGYGIADFEADARITANKVEMISNSGIATNYLTVPANAPLVEIDHNRIKSAQTGLDTSGLADGSTEHDNVVDVRGGGAFETGAVIQYAVGQVTLTNNRIFGQGNDSGVWLYHNEDPTKPVQLTNNVIRGDKSVKTADPGDSTGVFMTDDGDLLGDEDGDSYAALSGNTIQKWDKGIHLYRNGDEPAGGRTVSATANNGCISGNKDWGALVSGANESSGPDLDATSNWWGAASGPSGQGPGTGDPVSTHVTFVPFLTTSNCAP
jgi:hypothetical protein